MRTVHGNLRVPFHKAASQAIITPRVPTPKRTVQATQPPGFGSDQVVIHATQGTAFTEVLAAAALFGTFVRFSAVDRNDELTNKKLRFCVQYANVDSATLASGVSLRTDRGFLHLEASANSVELRQRELFQRAQLDLDLGSQLQYAKTHCGSAQQLAKVKEQSLPVPRAEVLETVPTRLDADASASTSASASTQVDANTSPRKRSRSLTTADSPPLEQMSKCQAVEE